MALALLLYPLTLLLITHGAAAYPSYFFPVASDAVTFNFHANKKSESVSLSTQFKYAGYTEDTAYINRNGFVAFYDSHQNDANPYAVANKNLFAPMWTSTKSGSETVTYKQSTSGADITLATSEIRSMYPEYPNFAATWALVVTWDNVTLTSGNKEVTFQAVLISDGTLTFVLFHYTAVDIKQDWMPGFVTKSQSTFTLLPITTFSDSTLVVSTSNVAVPGRWAFEVHSSINVYHSQTETLVRIMNQHPVIPDANGNSPKVTFQQPFTYFGRNYNGIYINKNGFLSFSEITDSTPRNNTGMDIIAPLWYQFSPPNRNIFYEEITSGSVLLSLTQAINVSYPSLNFTASWAFLVVFDRVSYAAVPGMATFEVILVSDGNGNSFSYFFNGSTAGLVPPYTIGLETLQNIYNTYKSVPAQNVLRLKGDVPVACTSGAVTCGTDEVCGEKNVIVGCYCDPTKQKSNPDIYDAVQTCNDNGGSLNASRCQLVEAGVLESDLHLQNTSCKGELHDNRLVFTFNNNDKICGGTYQINITHLMYYNSVSNITGIISDNAGLYLSISCVYPLIQKLSAPKSFLIVGSIIMKNIPAAEGTYQVLMEAYPDDAFTTPYNGSVTFNMNQEIFMAVTVVGFDSTKISTVLDSCWATPTDNINDTVRWNLITDECPDPMESSVTVLQNGVTTSGRFSFNMFTFNGFSDSIHLHCQVHLCLPEGNNCALPCGMKRRRRRAEEFHDTAAITMSF